MKDKVEGIAEEANGGLTGDESEQLEGKARHRRWPEEPMRASEKQPLGPQRSF